MIFSYDVQEEVVFVSDESLSPELEEVIRQLIKSFEEAESIEKE